MARPSTPQEVAIAELRRERVKRAWKSLLHGFPLLAIKELCGYVSNIEIDFKVRGTGPVLRDLLTPYFTDGLEKTPFRSSSVLRHIKKADKSKVEAMNIQKLISFPLQYGGCGSMKPKEQSFAWNGKRWVKR